MLAKKSSSSPKTEASAIDKVKKILTTALKDKQEPESSKKAQEGKGNPVHTPKISERLTTIVCTADVGWGNAVFIRGEGAGLSWEKGILMENVGGDRWEWSTATPHDGLSFKVLVNDTHWAHGDNLWVVCGGTLVFNPHF